MKKGKLALMIISGIIGISVIGNMLGSTSDKANNNPNSKNPENENAKIEQKAEKTEEQLKSEEEQKKKEEEISNEEKKKLEQKELEEKNKRARDAAIGAAATAAVVTSRNNREAKPQKTAEEARPAPVTRSAQTAEPQVDSNVRGVYITPNGKRYHYDPQCGGKNSYRVGINSVGGRTPCKKCVH
ncbi:MAG: hypothetical protein HG454_001015 [Clostridiales bacterium]|nr:hypothetical protein [Clostridiales bacterium]